MPPLVLGVLLLTVYLCTLAPGLTWANGGSDGGDLIAAAATGGIPHPTGYPLYLLLARLFQFLPAGSLAYRTNLMSAVFSAAASVLIYGVVARQVASKRAVHRILAGLAAGFCFGLSPLVWSQAVITEVYGLQAFLLALVIYLYSMPVSDELRQPKSMDLWRGLTLGLAMGNHLTSLLFAPLVLLVGSTRRAPAADFQGKGVNQQWLRYPGFDPHSLGRQMLGLVPGLSLYLTLPVRAMAHPPVNWGNPLTPSRLGWLVSGSLYQSYYFQFDVSSLLEQTRAWAGFITVQLGLFGIFIALFGLIVFGRISKLLILTVGMACAALLFSSIYHPADADVYLVPVLISFSIWLGLGIAGLEAVVHRHSPALAVAVGLFSLGVILFRPYSYVQQVDASKDHRAEAFGREVLAAVPEHAILFARGDRAIFTLWYFHFALHEREDLRVIATELLHFDWYQEVLQSTYPELSIPGPFPYPETIAPANPNRPVCRVEYTDRAEMECTTK